MYFHTLKQSDIARLEKLQYHAAKIVTGALPYSSKEKLNHELGWETLHKRAEFLGLTLFHKIHLQETRPLIRLCMPNISTGLHELRSNGGYARYSNY